MNYPQKKADLELQPVGGQFVIYEAGTDAIHYLNPTAALILELCDGTMSAEQIGTLVAEAFALPSVPVDDVNTCLVTLEQSGLIHNLGQAVG